MLKRRVFAGMLMGTVAMLNIVVQARVYSDASTVQAVQEKLNEAGFDCGTADGIAGSKTSEAILSYQNANRLMPSGEIDDELLESMGLLELGDTSENASESGEEALPEAGEAAEVPEDSIEKVTIEGTILYNANRVAVTAAFPREGQAVEYWVQNESENPVVVMPGDLVVNEVTMKTGMDAVGYGMTLGMNIGTCFFREDLEEYGIGIYVEAGAVDSMTAELDTDSQEEVSKLQASVGVIGLSKELLFDGTDEVSPADCTFIGVGSLTEVAILDTQEKDATAENSGKLGTAEDELAETEEAAEKVTEDAAEDIDVRAMAAETLIKENSLQPLCNAVAKSVYTEYAEPNGITSEDFKWPDEISDAWLYLKGIARDYSTYPDANLEELKNEKMTFYLVPDEDTPSIPTTEEELTLMNAVLDGIIVWYEENYDPHERSEFFTAYDELPSVGIVIAGGITFDDIEAAAE